MNASIRQLLAKRAFGAPQFDTRNVRYEMAERSQGLVYGGVAVMHQVAHRVGLPAAINRLVPLFKLPSGPYRESDHVLNIAFNALCEGRCLQDIQLRREDEAYCDALGADTIPAPSTEGDFCRRFTPQKILNLEGAIHEARLVVWKQQPEDIFAVATLDADGTQVVTGAECKEGIGMNYKKQWGYHPLIISLAETGEPLSIINRPGNRPSHEGAAAALDRQIAPRTFTRLTGSGTQPRNPTRKTRPPDSVRNQSDSRRTIAERALAMRKKQATSLI